MLELRLAAIRRLEIAREETEENFICFSCKTAEVGRAGLRWQFYATKFQGLRLLWLLVLLSSEYGLRLVFQDGTPVPTSMLQPREEEGENVQRVQNS